MVDFVFVLVEYLYLYLLICGDRGCIWHAYCAKLPVLLLQPTASHGDPSRPRSAEPEPETETETEPALSRLCTDARGIKCM